MGHEGQVLITVMLITLEPLSHGMGEGRGDGPTRSGFGILAFFADVIVKFLVTINDCPSTTIIANHCKCH